MLHAYIQFPYAIWTQIFSIILSDSELYQHNETAEPCKGYAHSLVNN